MTRQEADRLAAFEARQFLNWDRVGGSKSIREATGVTAFLRSWFAGTYQKARRLRADPVGNILRPIITGIASIALLSWIMSDEDRRRDYEERSSYERHMFNLFPWPNSKGEWLRIPKANDLVDGFTPTAMEILWRSARDPNFDGARDLREAFIQQGAPNLAPTGIAMLVELLTNYDFFSDRALVPKRLVDSLEARDRYTERTSLSARSVADILNSAGIEASPIEVEHVVRGLAGEVGKLSMRVGDIAIRSATGERPPAGQKTLMQELFGLTSSRPDASSAATTRRLFDELTTLDQRKGSAEVRGEIFSPAEQRRLDTLHDFQKDLSEYRKRVDVLRDRGAGSEAAAEQIRGEMLDRIRDYGAGRIQHQYTAEEIKRRYRESLSVDARSAKDIERRYRKGL